MSNPYDDRGTPAFEKIAETWRKANPRVVFAGCDFTSADSDKLELLIDGVEELNAQLKEALLIEDVGRMTYVVQGIHRALRVITDNAKG